MIKIKIKDFELKIGQPLLWPVYSENDQLLLSEGSIVNSEKQKQILISQGIFRQPTEQEIEEQAEQLIEQKFVLDSPFKMLETIKESTVQVLTHILEEHKSDYSQTIFGIASLIQKLCHENADAALGALILDQEAIYTHIHPILCAILTELLGKRRQISEQDRILFIAAALTQNLGMMHEQEILANQTSPLTDRQRQIINEHPYKSRDLLRNAGIDNNDWLNIVLSHHERIDGKGYPRRYSGASIPEASKIIALTDIYSAMVLPRKYRDGLFIKKALRDIFLQRGTSVDEQLAQLLIKEIGIYPPGAFVQLSNGETAIVLRRGLKNANTPLVLSILSPRGAPYKNPQQRDTKQEQLFAISKVVPRIDKINLNLSQIWGLTNR